MGNKEVQVNTDNTAALAYISKQGGTHSRSLYETIRESLLWAKEENVKLVTHFIQGEKKCEGGHSEQEIKSSQKNERYIRTLGMSLHRSLRHSANEEVGHLLLSSTRSRGYIHRRVPGGLVQLGRVCISLFQDNTQGTEKICVT